MGTPRKPPRTGSRHLLSFDALSPVDFERLCLWLVRREGFERAEHLGAAGSEQGRDIVAWRGERRFAFQCKRVKSFGAADARTEVAKLRALSPHERPHEIVFLVTTNIRAATRSQARQAWGDERTCHFWCGTELDEKVKRHPEILDEFWQQPAPSSQPPSEPQPKVSTSHLPTPGPQFVGRETELARLTAAWEDPHIHLLSIVAWGGVGKSALVDRWLTGLEKNAWGGAGRVYGWSFYSQGTQEQTAASADIFIDRALRWLGDPDPTRGFPRDRGLRLAELVRRQKTLLVLDGVEPLQHPPGPRAGKIRDPALAALLKELARQNPGLCVVTTREALADVAHLEDDTAPRLSLEELSVEDGAALLEALGVTGKRSELLAAAEEFGGHALALNLLGTYLKRAHGGDVRRRGEVPLLTADAKLGGHAFRVMEAYVRWFAARDEGEGPEVAVLRLLGLFDRPAEEEALAALRAEPAIPGLTGELVGLSEEDWQWALANLEECRLVKRALGKETEVVLDAHPLVREWFGGQLEKRDKAAFQAGHRRLYEHYKAAAPEQPDTLDEMQPLYAAVVHGCRAGEHQAAFDEVYRPRILRENELYQLRKLGAFGADLAALAGFFEHTWDRPATGLREEVRAWLLNQAGACLRALGRLPEAVGPMEAGLELRIAQEDWTNAAIQAGNLSELSLTLGEVARAVAHGEESVRLADRSGDVFMRMVNRTTLADALHQAGRWEESRATFCEAEAMQAERQPHYPRLYSLRGYWYCDLLLALGEPEDGAGLDGAAGSEPYRRACEEVAVRAATVFEWRQLPRWNPAQDPLLDIALDHLSLGRARLGLALTAAARDEASSSPTSNSISLSSG